MSSGKQVLDRKEIPGDNHAYVYRRADREGRWFLYFYNAETGSRHRIGLKDESGRKPLASIEGQDHAFLLGMQLYIDLKGKSDRGEKIQSLTFEELCEKFLQKGEQRISEIPHNGISLTRYRLLKSQIRWIRHFLGSRKAINRPIHKMKRNIFLNYEIWRKEEARKQEKRVPEQSTINQEMSTLRRIFDEVAVAEGYIKRDTVPEIPSIKLPKDQKHRRDDLTVKEWEELEKCSRRYYIQGKTRILDDKYTINLLPANNQGWRSYETKIVIPQDSKSLRTKAQLVHRNII